MRTDIARYLLLGALTGALAAATTIFPLADIAAPRVFGYCLGIGGPGEKCAGISATFYVFPGLFFGIGFAAAQLWRGGFDPGRAALFVPASGIANAVAVFVCVSLIDPLSDLIQVQFLDLPLALSGAIAGLAGGALLSGGAALLAGGAGTRTSIAAGAVLGLAVPLLTEFDIAGSFAFYILWQAGYAAALGADLSAGRER